MAVVFFLSLSSLATLSSQLPISPLPQLPTLLHTLTTRLEHATHTSTSPTTFKIPFLDSSIGPLSAGYMAPSAIEVEEINELAHTINDPPVEHNLEDHVAFGGDDQWFYHIPSRRFDLSRGSKRKLIIDADDGIRNHR